MNDDVYKANAMSDHQDTRHYSYNRSWDEIEKMLDKAERAKNHHHTKFLSGKNKKEKLIHARNFKALEGVCKTLRWVLGDMDVKHPLD